IRAGDAECLPPPAAKPKVQGYLAYVMAGLRRLPPPPLQIVYRAMDAKVLAMEMSSFGLRYSGCFFETLAIPVSLWRRPR
ncbi:ANXA6, partial [Symbiodinium microadriaticum]